MMTPANKQYRISLYQYHINGLDQMVENKELAKEKILNAIVGLNSIYSNNMSSHIYRVFMDAK